MIFYDSTYYEDSGKSEVWYYHNKKLYKGEARLHPEDREIASQFTGCRYGEMRAIISALKDEHRQKKAVCDENIKFVKALESYRDWDKESPAAKLVYRQLNKRIKQVNDLAEEIGRKQMELNIAIAQQDKLQKWKKNKEEVKND